MNDPEEARKTERDADKLLADMAELMLRHPSTRIVLRPLRRIVLWGKTQIDQWLKEEGWR